MRKRRFANSRLFLFFVAVVMIAAIYFKEVKSETAPNIQKIEVEHDDKESSIQSKVFWDQIPEYEGAPFDVINGNKTFFTKEEIDAAKNEGGYEYYEPLDNLGRATMGRACIDSTIRPAKGEKRGDISKVKPTGWKQNKYDFIENGGWLYNRSHILGYQLTGENDNVRNLITGTRQFNAGNMLLFENMVADYLKEDDSRKILYRVTAMYKEDELVARGVLMEALSVTEDDYDDLEYCVFIHNVQDGVHIDYKTGDNYPIK